MGARLADVAPWGAVALLVAAALAFATLSGHGAASARLGAPSVVGVTSFGSGSLVEPTGVAVAGERVYVADPGAGVLAVFDRNGSRVGTVGASVLRSPVYVAVDPRDGRVLVSDRAARSVFVFTSAGSPLGEVRPWGRGASTLDTRRPWDPLALAFSADGGLYVADAAGAGRIAVFDAAGRRVGTIAAAVPPGRTGKRFAFPDGLLPLAAGRVLVSDSGNGRLVLAGPGGDLEGRTLVDGEPRGVASLPGGGVVVADGRSRRLRVFGTPDASGAMAEVGAVGRFSDPNGVATDAAGRVYVADARAGAVVVLTLGSAAARR